MTEFLTRAFRPTNSPRTVVGYHGCARESAERIFTEQSFISSTQAFDWLGAGVYYWEDATHRALDWATARCLRLGGTPAVIRATITLGRCLNLMDVEHMASLARIYNEVYAPLGQAIPRNTEQGAHFLDREIIEVHCQSVEQETARQFQTVRGSFSEGEPIYPGSKIIQKTHTQIAVRDQACIVRASLVQFSLSGTSAWRC